MKKIGLWVMLLLVFLCVGVMAEPLKPDIILATTTSVYDTGLLEKLLTPFEQATGYKVKPLAVGSGEALALAGRGEADILIVHSKDDELKFMDQGYGIDRKELMHNYFVLAGPAADPAKIKGSKSVGEAFKKIAEAQAVFVSRGDKSGTNKKELKIWQELKLQPKGEWYLESGQGMAETLRLANEKQAYILSDIATYTFLKKNLNLEIMLGEDPSLINRYSVILVNPKVFAKINVVGARKLYDYLFSPEALKIIKNFGVKDYGKALFSL
jgi:tungstate transport system substrate-binding protein